MSKKRKIILISILAILAVFLVFYQKEKQNAVLQKVQTETKSLEVQNVVDKNSFILKAGDTTLRPAYQSEQTLYDALVLLQNNNEIVFLGKTYSSLGFFVTDIGPFHAGNGKNLIYYVNGKEAKVGVSSYIISKGDIILWQLE